MKNKVEQKTQSVQDALAKTDFEDLNCTPEPPIFVFPYLIQYILNTVAIGKSVPVEMVMCAFLALGSCCLGRSRGLIYTPEWKEYANLFFVMIAETGMGKSHVFNYFFDEVRLADEVLTKKFNEEWEKYQEDMAIWRKSKKEDRVDRPKPPKKMANLINDATIEAVLERLEHNPRGLFWEVDEFAGFFSKLDRYNKSGAGDGKSKMLTMWDSGKISVSRKNNEGIANELSVPKSTIGMYGAIQPELLKDTFTKDDIKQGVTQRFIFVSSRLQKKPKLPYPKIDPKIKGYIKKIVDRLLSLEMGKNEIGSPEAEFLTLDEDAVELFEEFTNVMHDKTFPGEMSGYSAKMARITLRLALIIHFLKWALSDDIDYSRTVQYETMDAATALANYFFAHSEKIHNLLNHGKINLNSSQMLCAGIILENEEEILKYWNDVHSVYAIPAHLLETFVKNSAEKINYKMFLKIFKPFVDKKKGAAGNFYNLTKDTLNQFKASWTITKTILTQVDP